MSFFDAADILKRITKESKRKKKQAGKNHTPILSRTPPNPKPGKKRKIASFCRTQRATQRITNHTRLAAFRAREKKKKNF